MNQEVKVPLLCKNQLKITDQTAEWFDPYECYRENAKELLSAEQDYTQNTLDDLIEKAARIASDYIESLSNVASSPQKLASDKNGKVIYALRRGTESLPSIYATSNDAGIQGTGKLIINLNEYYGKQEPIVASIVVTSDLNLMAWSVDDDGSEQFQIVFYDLHEKRVTFVTDKTYASKIVVDPNSNEILCIRKDEYYRPHIVISFRYGEFDKPKTCFIESDPQKRVDLQQTNSKNNSLIISYSRNRKTHYIYKPNIQESTKINLPDDFRAEYVGYCRFGDREKLACIQIHPGLRICMVDCIEYSPTDIVEIGNIDLTGAISTPLILRDFLVFSVNHSEYRDIYSLDLRQAQLPKSFTAHIKIESEAIFDVIEPPDWTDKAISVLHSRAKSEPETYQLRLEDLSLRKTFDTVPEYQTSNLSSVESLRLLAPSNDSVSIPLTIFHKKGIQFPAPVILTAYGSYGRNNKTKPNDLMLPLLEKGIIFVTAHVRGGGELGETWWREGCKQKKINSFKDLICVCEYLIEQQIAQPESIAFHGGSAGGMLGAGVLNMKPNLFCAIALDVPFVDPLGALSDPKRPLTAFDWNEWGNPLENQDDYAAIRSYSPYQNIHQCDYPPVLSTCATQDRRVDSFDILKWVHSIRDASSNPRCYLYVREGGHLPTQQVYESIFSLEFQYLFLTQFLT